MGDYTGTKTSATYAPDHLFAPDTYTLVGWNPAERITVNDATVTAAADAGEGAENCITANPGWFFVHAEQVTIERDKDHAFTATIKQQVRELTLVVEPTDDAAGRITEIAACLTGAAGTLDFATGTSGAALSVVLPFTKITEEADAGKWKATVRLLDITDDEQLLKDEIRYMDNNPFSTTLESTLSEALREFSAKKSKPLTLGGTLVEYPEEAEFSEFEISRWKPADGGDASAEM